MSDPNELEMHFRAEVLDKLEKCGLDRTRIKIEYRNDLQDYDITIDAAAEDLSEEQYVAVAEAASARHYIVNFSNEVAHNRYWSVVKSLEVPWARRRLEERGKLKGLPMYDAAQSDLAAYLRALEAHLGFVPGSVLDFRHEPELGLQRIIFRPPHDHEQIVMAVSAIVASNLRESGVIAGVFGGV